MKLVLVRHGESVGNFENRLQGQAEYDLTELGRRQAAATGERLARLKASALYTSPLLRALETSRAIGSRLGLEAQQLHDVSEYHFGELSGQTYAEIRQRLGQALSPERVYPGEEGREVFFQRVTRAMLRVAEAHPGQTVAVVSHGGPIALFCQSVLGLPYRRPMPFTIDNCSLNLIDMPAGGPPVLLGLNDVCHLKGLE